MENKQKVFTYNDCKDFLNKDILCQVLKMSKTSDNKKDGCNCVFAGKVVAVYKEFMAIKTFIGKFIVFYKNINFIAEQK